MEKVVKHRPPFHGGIGSEQGVFQTTTSLPLVCRHDGCCLRLDACCILGLPPPNGIN